MLMYRFSCAGDNAGCDQIDESVGNDVGVDAEVASISRLSGTVCA
jgi:hypothetical protein